MITNFERLYQELRSFVKSYNNLPSRKRPKELKFNIRKATELLDELKKQYDESIKTTD